MVGSVSQAAPAETETAAQMRAAPALFGILGPLEVTTPCGEPVAVPRHTHRGTLTALLLHAGQFCSRAWLIPTIWVVPPGSGAASLRAAIYGLRRALGDPLSSRVQTRQAGPRAGGYLIMASGSEVDLLAFRTLSQTGRAAWDRGDAGLAARKLEEARGLWRGPPCPDLQATLTVTAELDRLHEERLDVEDTWIDARLALGQHHEVARDLREMLAADPLREHGWAQLMLALARCGDQAGALEAYDSARAVITAEYGSGPGPELAEVRRQVLAGATDLLMPAGPRPG
jgi:DNA-binding SARP family transcriptional activator